LVDQINQQEKNEEIDKKDDNVLPDDPVSKEIDDNVGPANVEYITMPRLSDTMEEGTISTWLKKVGDQVSEGDILAEIETDKATMEFESFYEGNLVYIGVNEGETVKVDDLIAIISDSDVNVDDLLANYSKGPTSESSVELDNINNLDNEKLDDDDANQDIISNIDVLSNTRIFASPLAKKIAAEKNIDLSKIKGSGDNGRIIKNDLDDIDYHSEKQEVSVSDNKEDQVKNTQPITKISNGEESFDDIQNSSMRNAIAKRLSLSKFSAPHYYLGVEFNMDNAIAFREQYNSIPNTKISFNDIIIKACAAALKKHPQVNSQWMEDKIRLNHHVHVGVAVGVEDGLVVPVIKFADQETLHSINTLVRDYAVRAKSKKLRPDEIEGSTFTVSNLGMFGIQEFTSIINHPNSAILSIGSIVKKPVVIDDKIVVSNTMKVTLACDHRSVDGVTGSLFLETLKGFIENPVTILV
jgi:pyruvate dehydrogenase E2 component (dihydrolipoamide acetyltransferase)